MKLTGSQCHQQQRVNNCINYIKNLVSKAIREYAEEHEKQMRSTSPKKRKSDSTSQNQEVNEVIDVLKKGYIMTKHSNSSTSKPKFVYLSMSEKYLCWKSVDKNDEKRLEVCTISQVTKGGHRFLDKKDDRIKNSDCCLVILAEERTLILEAPNPLECQLFEEDIQRAIKYCRKMSLNYVYLVE